MRRPILLLLSLALLLGLGGCMPYVRQTPEEETTLITVGFSQVGAEADWSFWIISVSRDWIPSAFF